MSIRHIRCIVIRVPIDQSESRPLRPSEMLPWADPYIAALVKRCQQEVAQQVAHQRRKKLIASLKFMPRTSMPALKSLNMVKGGYRAHRGQEWAMSRPIDGVSLGQTAGRIRKPR